MDKRIFLTEVLWVCYGILMLVSLDVVFDGRHWVGAVSSLIMTVIFFICFMFFYIKKLSVSLAWFFGLYLVLSLFCFFLWDVSFFILVLNGLAYLLIIKFLNETREADFYWQCFFGYSFVMIILIMISLLYLPNLVAPYALLGFIVLLLIIQLALIVLQEGHGTGIRLIAQVSGFVFSGALIVGAIIWFLRPVLRFVIAEIGMGIAWVTIRIEMLIVYLISLTGSNKQKAKKFAIKMTTQKNLDKHHSLAHNDYTFILFVIGMVLLAAVIVGLLYYFYKRQIRYDGKIGTAQRFESVALESPLKKPKKDMLKAHKHPVRKSVFRLQKQALKQRVGRLSHLTLSDWLRTLDVSSEHASILSSYYGKVRYGGQELTEEEWKEFQESLHQVKDQIKKKKEK